MNIFQFPDTKSAQQFLDSFCEHPPIITAAQLTKIKIPIDAEKIGSVRLIDANIFTDYQTLNRILYGSRRTKESMRIPPLRHVRLGLLQEQLLRILVNMFDVPSHSMKSGMISYVCSVIFSSKQIPLSMRLAFQ